MSDSNRNPLRVRQTRLSPPPAKARHGRALDKTTTEVMGPATNRSVDDSNAMHPLAQQEATDIGGLIAYAVNGNCARGAGPKRRTLRHRLITPHGFSHDGRIVTGTATNDNRETGGKHKLC